MWDVPTLGGIKSLQSYLSDKKFALPIFLDGIEKPKTKTALEQRKQHIDDLIATNGDTSQKQDFRLQSETGKNAIIVTSLAELPTFTKIGHYDKGWNYLMRYEGNPNFNRFCEENSNSIINLIEYGRLHVRSRDSFLMHLGWYRFPNATTIQPHFNA